MCDHNWRKKNKASCGNIKSIKKESWNLNETQKKDKSFHFIKNQLAIDRQMREEETKNEREWTKKTMSKKIRAPREKNLFRIQRFQLERTKKTF